MQKYLDKITPQVSPVWRADELYLKVKGNMKYLFAMMDDETRFWIAQEVADSKYTHDARHLFRLAQTVANPCGRMWNQSRGQGQVAHTNPERQQIGSKAIIDGCERDLSLLRRLTNFKRQDLAS